MELLNEKERLDLIHLYIHPMTNKYEIIIMHIVSFWLIVLYKSKHGNFCNSIFNIKSNRFIDCQFS